MNSTTIQNKEKAAQLLWTVLIVGFFVIQAIIWSIAISFTANDKSHAVVADYDERALNWDDEIERRQASEQLGWSASVLIDPVADIRGVHVISIQLKNSESQPIADAILKLDAFHRAQAGRPQKIELNETSDGVYEGKITIRKSGFWQFEGHAEKAGDTFLIHEKQYLKANK